MYQLFDALQQVVLDDSPDYPAFIIEAQREQRALTGIELARSRPVVRLGLALRGFGEDHTTGTSDLAVLIRQVIRTHNRRLEVPVALWTALGARDQVTGLRVTAESDSRVELSADQWEPVWLPGAETIDELHQRRFETPAIGDGLLAAMSGYTSYQSEAQKAAVSSCLFAPPGTTTLITLPTGGGKSLCALLPAWTDSAGGTIKGGTTLVVVPTVALALDQQRQAEPYFTRAINAEYRPLSRTGGDDLEMRAAVSNGLRNGTLPILFTSPESLVHSELRAICMEAARAGTLKRLVIDEAHIVQTWGAGFRAEFQFLASLRRQLLEASSGTLRTVLLSATVSAECDQLLAHLFSESGRLNVVSGTRLRPEISYWFNYASRTEVRTARVLEALHHLPRPLILYVTRPEYAELWRQLLFSEGFFRTATFSGQTASDERRHILREWNSDRRDIIIGTSAFGLGVDKPDVRAVIHACLPEDADRFYQEVGRGGRDGCSSASLVCLGPDDEEVARSMTRSFLISTERALDRWEGMTKSAVLVGQHGDSSIVNTDSVPRSEPEMHAGDLNREWNEHTLLLMQRAHLLSITDTQAAQWLEQMQEQNPNFDAQPWLEIRVDKPAIVSNQADLRDAIGAERDRERVEVNAKLQDLLRLVRLYSTGGGGNPQHCIAHELARLYPGVALSCGGCTYCRQRGIAPYAQPSSLEAQFDILPGESQPVLEAELLHKLGARGVLNISWSGPMSAREMRELDDLLVSLVRAGFQQVVLSEPLANDTEWLERLVRELARIQRMRPHLLVLDSRVAPDTLPLFHMPTVVVYPTDGASRLHRVMEEQRRSTLLGELIANVVHSSLYLESEHGLFLNRVNGLNETRSSIESLLLEREEFGAF